MTSSTTNAEAIALLNDFASKYRDGRFHCAMNPTAAQELATAILSYLASHREVQEPVAGELLPCPFCGSAAEIERYGTPSVSTVYRCTECACRLETGEEWNHGADWNRRTAPPAGEVERLRAALDNCIDTLALVEQPSFIDKAHATDVAILGDRIGYGALMSCASALWRLRLSETGYPVGGEFVSGPCHATVLSTLKQARAALNGGREKGK